MRRPWKFNLYVFALAALLANTARGQVTDVTWTADPATVATWNSDGNWSTFIPDVTFGEAAVFDNGGTAFVNLSVPAVAQLRLDSGSVEIRSGGNLAVPPDMIDPDFGITNIGIGGLGRLDIQNGGQFSTDTLTMGGDAASTLSLAGSAAIEVNSDANLDRITRIEGPGVTAEVNGDLRFRGTYTPVITGGTHSTIQVALGNAALGGTLRPEFSGGFVPSLGDSWTLVTADSVSGSFSTIDASNLPALPRGTSVGVSVVPGNSEDVILSIANRLILTVDRGNGAMAVENVVGDPIEVDSYSIGSAGGHLDPDAWQSLQDSGVPGWDEANPSNNFLSELNPLGSSTLSTGDGPISLGSAFTFRPQKFGESAGSDITFQYGSPSGELVSGIVEFTGLENTLVLTVNTATGNGTLENDSSFPVNLLGYSIESAGGSLDAAAWNSLADQGQTGWDEANPTANALNELNLDNSLAMAPGSSFDLGSLFTVAGDQDLSLEFLFETPSGPEGDTNGDGLVDIVDLNNVRNNFGGGPEGDTNGDGLVDIVDLNNVRNNFGAMGGGGGGEQGILIGLVKYEGAAAAVPEPATWLLLSIGLIGLALRRRNAMKLGTWMGSLAVAAVLLTGSTVEAGLNTTAYITTANGGVGGPDGVVGVDGAVEGDMTGVGAVTLLDKDGNDMWNNGDDFIYLYDSQRITGAFTATVRVIGQTEAIDGRWGKNGIRASRDLTASSAFAMTQLAAGNGSQTGGSDVIPIRMAGRTTHGATINPGTTGGMFEDNIEGSPENTFASTGVTPTWVRLNYNPFLNTFSSQWAPDAGGSPGVWSDPSLASNSVDIGDEGVFVGLAYSAHDDMNFAQVTRGDGLHGITYDNYSLTTDAPPPVPVDFNIPAGTKSFDTDHPLTGHGDGLEGTWWKFDTANTLANAQAAAGTEPIDATFVATQLDYVRGPGEGAGGGTAIGTFLSPDPVNIAPGSAQTTATSSNNSFWRFQGFIDIREEHDVLPDQDGLQVVFAIPSDDATNLVIGGVEVLNNDGGHGFPGGGAGPSVVEFAEPGVYTLEAFLTQGGGGFGLELLSNLPGTNVGGRFGLTDTPAQSLLFTQAGIFPDFNGDSNVDNLDFAILRDNFLTGTTFAQGDMNRDFRVDLEDFRKFRNAFNLLNAAPAAVPEPGSLVLLALSAAVCGLFRRRRRVA